MVSKWQHHCFVHFQDSQLSDMTKMFLVNFLTTHRGKWSWVLAGSQESIPLLVPALPLTHFPSLSLCFLNQKMKEVDRTIANALLAGIFSESGSWEVLWMFHEVLYKQALQEISN